MSCFGSWQCPSCGSEWIGSIGWNIPESDEKLDELLHNICGCDGHIKDAPLPLMSCSILGFKETELRKQKQQHHTKEQD